MSNNFESFINPCCGEQTKCFYDCEAVDQKLRTKANVGSTYNKYQIDAKIESVRATVSYLQTQTTRLIEGQESLIPLATVNNKGIIYHTTDTNKLLVSTGTEWLTYQQKLSSSDKTTLINDITSAADIDELKTVLTNLINHL